MTSVLIVDDSAMDRTLAAGLLEQQLEIAVLQAVNGDEALQFFERHVPDIVVTDLMMPGMDGLELIVALKERFPLTPVVMMTARGSEEIAVEALEKGAASYVPKRNLSKRLAETVDRILQTAREEKNQARLMQRLVNDECAFVLENDLTLICTLVAYLRQGIRGVGLCQDSEHMRIGVALEEALLNAFYHGNLDVESALREQDDDNFRELARQRTTEAPYCDRRIYFHAKYSEEEAVFVIRDEGGGFDTSLVPDPTDPENLLRASGRGLLLMGAFMDEMRFNDVGNEVTLVKRACVKSPEPKELVAY
jgi:CheY-like chemotaxis protein